MHPSRGLARLSKQAAKAKAAQKAFMATQAPRVVRPSVVAPVMAGRQQKAPVAGQSPSPFLLFPPSSAASHRVGRREGLLGRQEHVPSTRIAQELGG